LQKPAPDRKASGAEKDTKKFHPGVLTDMWIFFKTLLLIIAVPALAGYGLALYSVICSALDHSSHARLGLAMVPAGMILWLLLGRFLRFFHVFEHEVTHLVTGLIFFIQPRQLVASESGGHMEMYGNNFIVSLAPYFVPLLSLVLMVLMPLLDSTVSFYACGMLGLATGYHFITNLQEFSLQQPDIRSHGLVFSTLICLLGNVVALGAIAGFFQQSWPGSWGYIKGGGRETAAIIEFIVTQLPQRIAGLL
jgi:hypothetical protein